MNDIKCLTNQKIRVRCISDTKTLGSFEIDEEYDAYYLAPTLSHPYSEIDVSTVRDCGVPFYLDSFFECFEVLTVGFEYIKRIEINLIGYGTSK